MPKQRIDGVIEAVHLTREGMIDWVRVYIRRGDTYTDRVILMRSDLIDKIQSGDRIFIGQRTPLLASTFHLDQQVNVIKADGKELISTIETSLGHDRQNRVPII